MDKAHPFIPMQPVRIFEYIGVHADDPCPDPPVWTEHASVPGHTVDLLVKLSGREVARDVELPALLRELADLLEEGFRPPFLAE